MVLSSGDDGTRPMQRAGVVGQVVDGEAILLDIQEGGYFSLNPVATRIWELCDGNRTLPTIVDRICDEFEVAPEVATADVTEIIDAFVAANLAVTG